MFEYDPEKSAINLVKHGIDFEAAQALWKDSDRIDGPATSINEARHMVVGLIDGRIWAAVVMDRGEKIRIISVRRARGKEAKAYDSQDDFGN
jgi:uncharacterized DUF497 family protein